MTHSKSQICPFVFKPLKNCKTLIFNILSIKNSTFFADKNGQKKVNSLKIKTIFLPLLDTSRPFFRTKFVHFYKAYLCNIQIHKNNCIRICPRFSSA
jgi:hypothetical protein